MSLEEVICRRMSIREFNHTPVDDSTLSTILWAAYGFSNGRQNIHGIEMAYATKIYVLKQDGVYLYDPWNHSLILWRTGDYRDIGQYDDAQVKLGLTWDRNKCSSEEYASAEIGEIGQNVYFMANALEMGTVTTASETNQLYLLGLPSSETPKIIMPLGYPKQDYSFVYDPLPSQNLPRIENSSMSLSAAIRNRNETIAWEGELTTQQQTQIVWASYGYSYYIDDTEKRHRTVPSSHGTYPLDIYAANKSGIYRYLPRDHAMKIIVEGDFRKDLGDVSHSFIASASVIIIPVLNKTMVDERYLWPWYYEAGASVYTVLLEATAWNLSANIISAIDTDELLMLLNLNDNYEPLLLVPVGKKKEISDIAPPTITIKRPQEGYLYVFDKEILPSPMTILIGRSTAVVDANDDYALQTIRFFVDGRAIAETHLQPFSSTLPASFFPNSHELKVMAYDYGGNSAVKSVRYVKIA
jgi:nitroreductase